MSLPVSMFGNGTFFLLRANGESMIDAGIAPGDLVLVRKQSEARDGEICINVNIKMYKSSKIIRKFMR